MANGSTGQVDPRLPMDKPRILIVDDDAALGENLAEIVASLDVSVELVDTAAAALQRVAGHSIDLALVDIRLPDGSGIDLIPSLRVLDPLIEVVLITGDATIESAIAAVRGGAFSYIVKPFSGPDLLEIVKRALGRVAMLRERERLRGELEHSERRYRELVDAVPTFVAALDAAGRISVWNERLVKVTGHGRDEMVGRPGRELVRGGGVRTLPTKTGGARLVRWELATVSTDHGDENAVYAVGIDVTEEQAMLRRMVRAERLAAIGTTAAGLAHEIRNPLNSAMLQLEVLRRRVERGDASPDAVNPVLSLIEDEIKRLERLVAEFLAFLHPRPLDLRLTDVANLCGDVLDFVRPEAEAARVRLCQEFAGALPVLSADPERLRQVLLNLLRNSVEAMPDGGTLTVRTRRGAPGYVEIDVEDTGVGFADEAPIFDAFFTTKTTGTGLGLSIVHRIVEDHHGNIRVQSRAGYTCFTLSLPIGPP
jgi:signal transduction histidine kinase